MFPASTRLEEDLTKHLTTYVRTQSKLAPFYQLVQDKINSLEFKRFAFFRRIAVPFFFTPCSPAMLLLLVSTLAGRTRRGVLTIEVSSPCQSILKPTRDLGCWVHRCLGRFTRTGTVSGSLPHPSRSHDSVVLASAVVLSQKVPKGEKHWNQLGQKQKHALVLYDELREQAGLDAWDVVYHLKDNGEPELSRHWTCLARKLKGTRPIGWSSRPVTHVPGQTSQKHLHQRPHSTDQPITSIILRQTRTRGLGNISC